MPREEPAHELARREAEAEATARQKEKDRVHARRSRALTMLLELMDSVLGKVRDGILYNFQISTIQLERCIFDYSK